MATLTGTVTSVKQLLQVIASFATDPTKFPGGKEWKLKSPAVITSTTDEVSRYAEIGIFYPNTTIYFRNAPDLNSPIQGTYGNGESVNYDLVVLGKSYNWISWISASTGVRRYMPIRDKATGEKWGYAV